MRDSRIETLEAFGKFSICVYLALVGILCIVAVVANWN
jgi:hypothetical protein